MNSINSVFNIIKSKATYRSSKLPQQGIYHFTFQENNNKSRIHLRIDPDGNGLLIINANRIIHLNPTASLMAYLILQKTQHEQAIKIFTSAFDVSKEQTENDYAQIAEQLQELIKPDGACPIHDLNLEIIATF